MKLLQNIRNKVSGALSGVGNFIDRDKSMQGVQLAKGGLGNAIKNIPNTQVGGYRLADQVRAYPQALASNMPWTPEGQARLNTNIQHTLGKGSAPTTVAQGFNNWVVAPLAQVPYNVGQTFAKDKTILERGGHALQAGFGLLPGIDDALFAGYNALKTGATNKSLESAREGLAGNEFAGIGDVVTGGQDNTLSRVLNTAELPLMLAMGGVKAVNSAKNARRARAVTNMTTDVVNKPIEDVLKASQTLSLPQPQIKTTLKEAQKLIRQGDNLDGVTVTVKNAKEARRAVRAGVPANKINIPTKSIESNKTLYSSDVGIIKTPDIATEVLKTTPVSGGKSSNWWSKNMYEPTRYLDSILPDSTKPVFNQYIKEPLVRARGESADFIKGYQDQIKSMPKSGSKDSKLIQQYGENVITKDQLIKQVGEQKANQIEAQSNQFRQMYDEILDVINQKRASVGLKPISKREDYFRHMSETSGFLDNLTTGKGTDTISSAIMKQRKGDKTKYDATGGFLDYLEYAGRAGFTDTVTPSIRTLSKNARDSKNFEIADYLKNWAKDIEGSNPIPSGAGRALDKIGARMRQSRVIGNASTLINQFASLPTGMSDAGWRNTLRGFSKEAKEASKQSNYLKDVKHRQPTSFYQGLNLDKRAGAVLQDVDVGLKETVWRGMYHKAKQSDPDNAVALADQMTELAMGSRGIGSQSQFQSSVLGRIVAPFTSEAQTQANQFFQLLGRGDVKKVAQIVIANHIFNSITEQITGNRVSFDPIQATKDAWEQYNGSDKKEPDSVKAFGRLLGETLNSQPVLQSITANSVGLVNFLGKGAGADGDILNTRELFGSDDPTRMNSLNLYNPLTSITNPRNVTGNRMIDTPLDLVSRFIPFGNQLSKTAQATASIGRGASESSSGRVMYEMPDNFLNQAQALVFGQSSTPQARDYFSNDFNRSLSPEDTDIYNSLPDNQKSQFLESRQNQIRQGTKLDSILQRQTAGAQGGEYSGATGKQQKDYTNQLLKSGLIPDERDLKESLFNGNTANDKSFKTRKEVYGNLAKAMKSEDYTDEQKQAILKASGANEQQWEFFRYADLTNEEKLEELVPTLGDMSDPENFTSLAIMRAKLGGQQGLTTGMIDYLYQNDVITKDQQKLLKAIEYDELKQEFYIKKGSRVGGSGGFSKTKYNEFLRLYSLDVPKLESKQYHYQTPTRNSNLIDSILNRRA